MGDRQIVDVKWITSEKYSRKPGNLNSHFQHVDGCSFRQEAVRLKSSTVSTECCPKGMMKEKALKRSVTAPLHIDAVKGPRVPETVISHLSTYGRPRRRRARR